MASEPSLSDCRSYLERQQALQQQQQRRLGRRIHDIVSQKLTLLSLQLSLAGMDTNPPANWTQTCRTWSSQTIDLGQALRELINDLKPRVLDENGLVAALQWYAGSLPDTHACRVAAPDEPVRVPAVFANELFCICRDIIGGVFLPKAVKETTIELEVEDGTLLIHLRTSSDAATVNFDLFDAYCVSERMLFIDGAAEFRREDNGSMIITLSAATCKRPAAHSRQPVPLCG